MGRPATRPPSHHPTHPTTPTPTPAPTATPPRPQDGVVAAAEAAVRFIESSSNSPYTVGLLAIESATKQVVSGVKYALTLTAAPTPCTKADVAAGAARAESCAPDAAHATRYTVTVLSQPWRTPPFVVNVAGADRVAHGPAPAPAGV